MEEIIDQVSLGKINKSFTLTSEQTETLDSIALIINENRSETLGQLLDFFKTFILENPQLFRERTQLLQRKKSLEVHNAKMDKQREIDLQHAKERKEKLKQYEIERKKKILEATAKMHKSAEELYLGK